MTTDPEIHVEKFHMEMDLRELDAAIERTLAAACTANPLFSQRSETLPQPTVLTMEDIREAMYKCGFPRPETPGQRALRHLREMGIEIRLIDPKALFTIRTA